MFKKTVGFLAATAIAVAIMIFLFDYLPLKTYQTKYEDEVNRWSDEFSVDPALVYAVIKVESNFDPGAHSEVGAIGLMQIIEDSFDWVAWRTGRTDLKFEDMYIPDNSIMFGTYMLSFLYERCGSIELTAAAYHAGMGTVDGWIASGQVDPENVQIENIQGENTQHYVRKIVKAYNKYSDILKNEKG